MGWSGKILAIDALRLNETQSDAMLDLAGTLDLNGAQPAFVLAGVWERLRWPLTGDALAESPQGKLDVDGDLDSFRYALTAQAFGQQIPETSLTLTGTGDTAGTKLEQLLLETLGGRVEGKGSAAWSPALTWDMALNAADIDPGLQWAGLEGKIALKADSSGGLDDGFTYQAKLDAALAAYPAAVVNLTGTGTGERARIDALNIETLGGGIDGSGEVAWAPALTWDLKLNANDLDPGRQYPGLDGRVALDLISSGGLEQGFSYSAKGNANLTAYPPAVLDIAGTGGADSTKLETLAVQLLGGRIDGAAEVAWAPELSWSTALTAKDLDPGKLLADWPGRIGGRIESNGKLTETGPDLTARIIDFGGDLRGYPVRLEADAAVRGEEVELRRLQANSGATRLSADGRLTDRLDFRFDFELAGPRHAAAGRQGKPQRRWPRRRDADRAQHRAVVGRARCRGERAGHRAHRRAGRCGAGRGRGLQDRHQRRKPVRWRPTLRDLGHPRQRQHGRAQPSGQRRWRAAVACVERRWCAGGRRRLFRRVTTPGADHARIRRLESATARHASASTRAASPPDRCASAMATTLVPAPPSNNSNPGASMSAWTPSASGWRYSIRCCRN